MGFNQYITSGTTCHAKFHVSEASGYEEEDFNIFLSKLVNK